MFFNRYSILCFQCLLTHFESKWFVEIIAFFFFFLLYDLATFNAVDKIWFILLFMEFRNKKRRYFQLHVGLDKSAYMLRDWKAKLYPNSCLHTTMEQTLQSHCVYFPRFIRNVHHHFIENCSKTVFSFI